MAAFKKLLKFDISLGLICSINLSSWSINFLKFYLKSESFIIYINCYLSDIDIDLEIYLMMMLASIIVAEDSFKWFSAITTYSLKLAFYNFFNKGPFILLYICVLGLKDGSTYYWWNGWIMYLFKWNFRLFLFRWKLSLLSGK